MQVAELWRYPVKSMQGERLDAVEIGLQGVAGDRQWAVVDGTTGLALTARREPQLLFAAARLDGPDAVVVELPDGTVADDDRALSAWLGRPVTLRRAGRERGTYEIALDFEDEAGSEWIQWNGPADTYHDSERTRVSLVATGSMRDWDRRRFRANVVLDAPDGADDALLGRHVEVGRCRLDVVKQIDRCVMTTRPQPAGIERDLGVLRTINAERATVLGVGAGVVAPGRVAVGDPVVTV